MKSKEKFFKIMRAIKNVIESKDNSTDVLYHLQKEFPEYKNIKKLFNNEFDKEFLKGINVLKEEQSETDKRKVEYKLDELHKLYKKYVGLCEKYSCINCPKIVGNLILHAFIAYYIQTEYNILEKIEKELKNTLLAQKEKDRGLIGFYSPYMFSKSPEEIFIENEIQNIKNILNIEKLYIEIKFLMEILQNFNNV